MDERNRYQRPTKTVQPSFQVSYFYGTLIVTVNELLAKELIGILSTYGDEKSDVLQEALGTGCEGACTVREGDFKAVAQGRAITLLLSKPKVEVLLDALDKKEDEEGPHPRHLFALAERLELAVTNPKQLCQNTNYRQRRDRDEREAA